MSERSEEHSEFNEERSESEFNLPELVLPTVVLGQEIHIHIKDCKCILAKIVAIPEDYEKTGRVPVCVFPPVPGAAVTCAHEMPEYHKPLTKDQRQAQTWHTSEDCDAIGGPARMPVAPASRLTLLR